MDGDSMYPDAGQSEAPSKPSADKEHSKDENTELVSKTFLGLDEDDEAKTGHKCTVEVVKDYGKEVEIRYVKDHKERESETEKEEMSADDELDSIEAASTMKG